MRNCVAWWRQRNGCASGFSIELRRETNDLIQVSSASSGVSIAHPAFGRREFAAGGTVNGVRVPGIPIHGPAKPEVQSIEVGINRVYAAFALNQILVFEDLVPG